MRTLEELKMEEQRLCDSYYYKRNRQNRRAWLRALEEYGSRLALERLTPTAQLCSVAKLLSENTNDT